MRTLRARSGALSQTATSPTIAGPLGPAPKLADVRTCPACGEDTKAGYAEACTKCGFSPSGEQTAEPEAGAPELTIGEQAEPPPPEGPPSGEPPPPESAPKKKHPGARTLIWLVVIGAAIGADRLGVFDQATGPDADQVEEAIADDAQTNHGVQVSVDCPDDADQTAVDESFFCTVTGPKGETLRLRVINHEDSFEWQSGPLGTLG